MNGHAPITDTRDSATVRANPGVGASDQARLRILLVDDHVIMRDALKALLQTDPKVEIVGEAGTVAEALDAADELNPSVIVIDIGLPGRSGLELAAELRARESPARVLVLTAHASEEFVTAALKAGVLGYVLKDASHAVLMKGLRAVSVGQIFVYICAATEARICRPLKTIRAVNDHTHVTRRERDVLRGIAHGDGNKEIARTLAISIKTVEKHRGNLMRKLDLHNTATLTMFAFRHGLV